MRIRGERAKRFAQARKDSGLTQPQFAERLNDEAERLGIEVPAYTVNAITQRENARLNDCRIRVSSAPSGRRFSLVLANLPADVHPKVAESLQSRVAEGGALLVTGYDTPAERDGLVELYRAGGLLELAREEYSGQWSVMRFARTAQ